MEKFFFLFSVLIENIIDRLDRNQAYTHQISEQEEETEESNLEDNFINDDQKIVLEKIKECFPIKTEEKLQIFDDSLKNKEIRKIVVSIFYVIALSLFLKYQKIVMFVLRREVEI